MVTVVVMGIAGSASAAKETFRDPVGDASARSDLTKVAIINGATRLTVRAHTKNLRSSGTQIFGVSVTTAGSDTTQSVTTVRRGNGRVKAQVTNYSGSEAVTVECGVEARWKPAKDTIGVSVPRDCIAGGAVRLGLYTGIGDGTRGDPADWTDFVRIRQG